MELEPPGRRASRIGRRTFVRIGAIAGGLALLAPARPAAGATEAMLLSCMDYRLLHEIDQELLMNLDGTVDRIA